MGLTSAMYTGLTGLNVNQTRIETIGHNIANVNTTAYKGSRSLFQTQFSQTLSHGTPPSDDSGGTNPMQIGHGAVVGTTQRTTSGGSLETTGLAGDLAIEGGGYFVVQDPGGQPYYTRDGSFSLNSEKQLVSIDGYRVMGYGVDQDFNIDTGNLQPLTIPIGRLSVASATENVTLDGELSAAAVPASAGSEHRSQAMVSGGGAAVVAGTALTDVRSAAVPGTPLFADGDTITLSGASKGDRELQTRQFVVGTDGTTLGDLATWLQENLGIQDIDGVPGDPGVVIEGGALVIRSNTGKPNAVDIRTNDVTSSNVGASLPLQFSSSADAVGGGVSTSFTVYDSLGNAVPVNATFALESTPNTGPVWRYYLEAPQAPAGSRLLGTGTVAFDTDGTLVSATGNEFSIDRSGTGAASPVTFTMNFSEINGLSTQNSSVVMNDQDGYPPGDLINYSVGEDGTVAGVFSNGLTRTIGQVVVATFSNEAGLVAETDNLFSVGSNSGQAAITPPGTLGAGLIRGGALEMSNVDISREFIGLITSSTGFQAASRVISTSNEMLDQLMMTIR